MAGVVASGIETPVKTAQFDLALNVTETHAGLRVAFDYATELFERRDDMWLGGRVYVGAFGGVRG